MTTTAPTNPSPDVAPPADTDVRGYHGHHVTWCTNRDSEYELHDDGKEPYCSHVLHGVPVTPDDGDVHAQLWVSPTHAFVHGRFTPAQEAAVGRRYNGVAMTLETWDGQQHRDQYIRMTSDAARSLAACLIRAADIEQGLTR